MKWIKVGDKLPDNNNNFYLIWQVDAGDTIEHGYPGVAFCDHGEWCNSTGRVEKRGTVVTHWAEVAPPKA